MEFFLNFCIGFIYLCLSFAFYYLMHFVDGHSIVEVGYRSQQMYNKALRRAKGQPYWDYLSYWTLCKNAKKNQKAVWIFFAIHLIPLFASPVSVILWPIMLFFDPKAMFGAQMGFAWVVFFIHTGIHMVIDDKYLPSERKRRHLFRFGKDIPPK